MSNQSRTVNINDWLNRRHGGTAVTRVKGAEAQVTGPTTMADLEDMQQVAQTLAEEIQQQAVIRARQDRLEPQAKPCSECSEQVQHYKEDYICYQCRDRLESDA